MYFICNFCQTIYIQDEQHALSGKTDLRPCLLQTWDGRTKPRLLWPFNFEATIRHVSCGIGVLQHHSLLDNTASLEAGRTVPVNHKDADLGEPPPLHLTAAIDV